MIHVTGHIVYNEDGNRQLIAICRPIPHRKLLFPKSLTKYFKISYIFSIQHRSAVGCFNFLDKTFFGHEVQLCWRQVRFSYFFDFLVNYCFIVVNFRMYSLLGYKPEHLMGKSLYELHHGCDSDYMMATFKSCEYIFFYFCSLI